MRRVFIASLPLLVVALSGVALAQARLEGKCLLGVLGQKDDSVRARALWRSLGGVGMRARRGGEGAVRTYPEAGVEVRLDGRGAVQSIRLMLGARRGAVLRKFRGRAPFHLDPSKLSEDLRAAAAKPGGTLDRFRFLGLRVTLRLAGAPARFTEMTVATTPDVPIGDLSRHLRACPYEALVASDPAPELTAPPLGESKRPRIEGDCLVGLLGRSLDGPEVASLRADLGAPEEPSGYQLVFPLGLEVGGNFFDKRVVREVTIDLRAAAPFPGRMPSLPAQLLRAAASDAAGFALWSDGRVSYRLFVDHAGKPRKLTLLGEGVAVTPLFGCAFAAQN